jgi:hypothetical protein
MGKHMQDIWSKTQLNRSDKAGLVLLLFSPFILIVGGALYLLSPFLSFLLLVFIIYIYLQQKTNDAKTFAAHKRELEQKGEFKLIQNFVKHNSSFEILDTHFNLQGMDLIQLNNLLSNKGINLENWELIELISDEYLSQMYDYFKSKILFNHPNKLDDYITNYLDFFGEQITDTSLKLFIELLTEKKLIGPDLDITQFSLRDKIEEMKKKRELDYFEHKISGQAHKQITIDELDALEGHEFEDFLKRLFTKMGYSVEKTPKSHDQGADLIMTKLGEKIVVQAKQYTNTVGNSAIQEVVASIKHYGADRGMVVTTNGFSRPAIALAKSNHIELIDRHKLKELIDKYF